MNTLPLLLKIAGLLHLGLIAAGLTMPRVVGLRGHLAPLPQFVRQLYWVYYSFIAICLVGFGALSFGMADVLAAGGPLARVVCLFLTAFWLVRLFAASFIYDVRPYLTSLKLRLGYHATNAVFIYLPVVYAWTAWKGGAP